MVGVTGTEHPNILHRVGNTSLLPLRNILPASGARIVLNSRVRTPRAA